MKRIAVILLAACAAVLAVIQVINFYDQRLQVGRMWETPAIRPHETPVANAAVEAVPLDGGENLFRAQAPESLRSPLNFSDPAVVLAGEQGYRYYCIQCHGKYHDGNATVGQSFAPPPGDLRSAKVQEMHEGRLFHEISYGIPGGRQPALATTISVEGRWQIIAYIRSLGVRD